MQYGQANFPVIMQPDSMPYAGKSFMIHISATLIWKFSFNEISYIATPTSQSIFNSSMSCYRNISILLFGLFSPGIISVKNIYSCLMHINGWRLKGVMITGQHEYVPLDGPYGENPSTHNPNLTLHGSRAKWRCILSKCFHASPSNGWESTPDSRGFSWCHLILAAVAFDANSLWSLGVKGKYHIYFLATSLYPLRLALRTYRQAWQSMHCFLSTLSS